MLYHSSQFTPVYGGEGKPSELFVDYARGVIGFGLTYGEYSYNHQPLFGTTLQPGSPASRTSAGRPLSMGGGLRHWPGRTAVGDLPY